MKAETNNESRSPRRILPSIIALVWVTFFVFAFFKWSPTFPFPNGQETVDLTRFDILGTELGESKTTAFKILANSLLDNVLGGIDPKTEGWRFFQGRLVLIAAGLILGILALGRLLMRLLRQSLTPRLEANVFAYGLGVSAVSLMVLAFGLAGVLNPSIFCGVLGIATVVEAACLVVTRRTEATSSPSEPTSRSMISYCVVLVSPVLLMMLLGALSPPTDFDVREYHLQGPKEYFQNGQITFLPHNAYTSFPFLTEMLSLLGMVVVGDWYEGALLGKLLLAAFTPMTALALIAAGRRCFDSKTGWLAAVVFLTTPWIYRISIIAYAESGLTFFLFASLLAVARFAQHRSTSNVLLAGLMCGSAMACKYPALLSVVAPVGISLFWLSRNSEKNPSSLSRTIIVFVAGVAIAVGPWLLKNLVETGNPVYPLAYSVFGGTDWTPEINTRWKAGHSPPNHKLTDLASRVTDVTIRSDWMSVLLFAFAPLAFLSSPGRRRSVIGFWLFVLWMFGSWWVFTHRIDRFWVPMIPAIALLAGAGLNAIRFRPAHYVMLAVLTIGVAFNTLFCASPWSGYNAWFQDPVVARKMTEQQAAVLLRAEEYNNRSSQPGRVLCVGEAAVFEAKSAVVYNTVFDLNIFQEICGEHVTGGPDGDVALRDIEDIRSRFIERDIRLIVVNWNEVLRYRAPGSYGFSDFIRPETFRTLVDAGILQRLDAIASDINRRSQHDQKQIEAWGTGNGTTYPAQEIFGVVF
ncbi:MAG: ArnT family glycosyltransferase [Planctomycetaceae bacterium]